MKIGNRATLAELDAKGWTAFAADAGLGLPLVRRRVSEISERVTAMATETADTLNEQSIDQDALCRFAKLPLDRAARCAMTFGR